MQLLTLDIARNLDLKKGGGLLGGIQKAEILK